MPAFAYKQPFTFSSMRRIGRQKSAKSGRSSTRSGACGQIGDHNNWLEHAAILTRNHPGATLEKPSEKRRIFVAYLEADLVHRHLPGFKQALCFLNAQVL